ncbi:hypothetical protein SASPL_113390 [Salvia splendens]|uniref:X8 domain-containing protein n=1 Tax=Salvia splendens TaxID=180675 RepID=A0A8X8Y2Q8_SALSN|nr:hypothetical protein SASPL_113390 [Salvia splendens]
MATEAVFGVVLLLSAAVAAGNWCVVRSDASEQALQTALDYACSAGADCSPIQPNGLCFLPNTLQAHASYAFNSYYQRKNNAPDSCSFASTSTIARTDPSYGSCVYPSSARTLKSCLVEIAKFYGEAKGLLFRDLKKEVKKVGEAKS